MPIENIEKDVIKKTNKYVYFNDGSHMTYSDFHKYKQDIRKEYALLHKKDFSDSEYKFLIRMSVIDTIRNISGQKSWEKYYRESQKKCDDLNKKIIDHGKKLYKDLTLLPILDDLQIEDGIKFIIQGNNKGEYRFCFDPYRLVDNFHSSLSEMYRNNEFYTINGGWIKIIEDNVVLYKSSGDYGVYDDKIGLSTAKKIFPNKQIYSHAGKDWIEIEDLYKTLPF